MSGRAIGHIYQDKPCWQHPSLRDIEWAAGFFEGEGSFSHNRGSGYVCISQNNSWPNEKMQRLFGGTLKFKQVDAKRNPHITSFWFITGPRARGFVMTIYSLLSPKRQMQIRAGLLWHTSV